MKIKLEQEDVTSDNGERNLLNILVVIIKTKELNNIFNATDLRSEMWPPNKFLYSDPAWSGLGDLLVTTDIWICMNVTHSQIQKNLCEENIAQVKESLRDRY